MLAKACLTLRYSAGIPRAVLLFTKAQPENPDFVDTVRNLVRPSGGPIEECKVKCSGRAGQMSRPINTSRSNVNKLMRLDPPLRRRYFNMMCRIGEEIEECIGVITLKKPAPSILDLCAAPGGFIATALRYNSDATVCGISFPKELGGHPLLVPRGKADQ
jgi:hypothetical protein